MRPPARGWEWGACRQCTRFDRPCVYRSVQSREDAKARRGAGLEPCQRSAARETRPRGSVPMHRVARPSYPHAPSYSLPTPPVAGFEAGFARAGRRAGAGNISNYTVFGTVGTHQPTRGRGGETQMQDNDRTGAYAFTSYRSNLERKNSLTLSIESLSASALYSSQWPMKRTPLT